MSDVSFAAHVTRREPVLPPEAPVEIREVAETDIIGDGADRSLAGIGIEEQPVRSRQTLIDQKFRESRALRLEQALYITRGYIEARCDGRDRNVAPMTMRHDEGFREVEAGRLQPAHLGRLDEIG